MNASRPVYRSSQRRRRTTARPCAAALTQWRRRAVRIARRPVPRAHRPRGPERRRAPGRSRYSRAMWWPAYQPLSHSPTPRPGRAGAEQLVGEIGSWRAKGHVRGGEDRRRRIPSQPPGSTRRGLLQAADELHDRAPPRVGRARASARRPGSRCVRRASSRPRSGRRTARPRTGRARPTAISAGAATAPRSSPVRPARSTSPSSRRSIARSVPRSNYSAARRSTRSASGPAGRRPAAHARASRRRLTEPIDLLAEPARARAAAPRQLNPSSNGTAVDRRRAARTRLRRPIATQPEGRAPAVQATTARGRPPPRRAPFHEVDVAGHRVVELPAFAAAAEAGQVDRDPAGRGQRRTPIVRARGDAVQVEDRPPSSRARRRRLAGRRLDRLLVDAARSGG